MFLIRNLDLFDRNFVINFSNYELENRYFEEGDFGSLDQVNFHNKELGGNIDFWGLGWVGIYVWDYKKEKELLNVLFEPNEKGEIKKAFKKFKELI